MAARNTSVSLGKHFTEFIEQQVESGRYNTASEVIRDGLRMVEEREEKLALLRAEIAKGMEDFEHGRYREMTEGFWEEINRKVHERVTQDKEARRDGIS